MNYRKRRSKKILFLMILCVFISPIIKAQILNIDRVLHQNKVYKEDKNTYLSLMAGYNFLSQEQTFSIFTFNGDITFLKNKNALIFLSDINLTKSDNTDLVNLGYAQFVYRYGYKAKVTPELIGQYQWNGPLGMDDRFLTGINCRFKVKSDSTKFFLIAAGLMYEWEKWNYIYVTDASNPNDSYKNNSFKLNTYFYYMHRFTDYFDASVSAYVQTKLDEDFIYPRIAPSLQLNFKINKVISFVMAGNLTYDAKPVIDIKKAHFYISNSIKINL